jgi:hypothetical protein
MRIKKCLNATKNGRAAVAHFDVFKLPANLFVRCKIRLVIEDKLVEERTAFGSETCDIEVKGGGFTATVRCRPGGDVRFELN